MEKGKGPTSTMDEPQLWIRELCQEEVRRACLTVCSQLCKTLVTESHAVGQRTGHWREGLWPNSRAWGEGMFPVQTVVTLAGVTATQTVHLKEMCNKLQQAVECYGQSKMRGHTKAMCKLMLVIGGQGLASSASLLSHPTLWHCPAPSHPALFLCIQRCGSFQLFWWVAFRFLEGNHAWY